MPIWWRASLSTRKPTPRNFLAKSCSTPPWKIELTSCCTIDMHSGRCRSCSASVCCGSRCFIQTVRPLMLSSTNWDVETSRLTIPAMGGFFRSGRWIISNCRPKQSATLSIRLLAYQKTVNYFTVFSLYGSTPLFHGTSTSLRPTLMWSTRERVMFLIFLNTITRNARSFVSPVSICPTARSI